MVKLTQRLSNAFQAFQKTNNSGTLSGRSLARDFLVNGDRTMKGNWSITKLADKDMLKGYPYAALDLRAKTVARLGFDVITSSYKEGSLKKDADTRHPYIAAIEDSTNFDNYKFWVKSSKYIDMRGVRYIAFVRGKTDDGVVGNVTDVYALNSYMITEVVNKADGEIGGYIETNPNTGGQRTWEPHQIVRITDDNPITDDPLGRIEAAKEAQFTLKQAGDFTRSSLNANENAPGIISTKLVLDPEQFTNFKEGIKNSSKGQPIITNGGQVDWQAMNIDLDKSALDKINEIQRSELFAVTGQSKTSMGIEESGTTRDTSEVQDDKQVRDQAIPTIKLIASALDLDYRKNYPKDFELYGWSIKVADPTAKNIEAEKEAIAVREGEFDLAQKLISQGYDVELSRKYAKGEIGIDQLGEPKKQEPVAPTEPKETNTFNISPTINIPETKAPDVTVNSPAVTVEAPVVNIENKLDSKPVEFDTLKTEHEHSHDATPEELETINNNLEVADQNIVMQQQGALTNGIINIDNRIVSLVTNKVTKNAFENESDIIDAKDRDEIEAELELLLMGFYTVLFGLYGRQLMQKRSSELGQLAEFKMNRNVTDYIRSNAVKASKSHVDTVVKELHLAVKEAYAEAVELKVAELTANGEKATKAIYAEARKLALEGAGRQQIISAIKAAQSDISTKRATTIARNETRKAFTQTQYQADTQFLTENGFIETAEKRWRTNSSNPCGLCLDQAARGWIPFRENFVNKGETLTYDYEKKDGTVSQRSVVMDYEDIDAGLLHVNCACQYDLRITSEEQ